MKFETIAVHGGYKPDPTTHAVAVSDSVGIVRPLPRARAQACRKPPHSR